MLKQEPVTFTSSKGQQPAGYWAITGHDAEAGAASGAKGIRYNSGTIHMAGDGAPGPLAMGNGGAGGVLTASGGLPRSRLQLAFFALMRAQQVLSAAAAFESAHALSRRLGWLLLP
jgi:hypothetical protein